MLNITFSVRPVVYLAIATLLLALAQSANAQGCRGSGGGMGYSQGGMGGGYMASSMMGGMGQPYGMMGGSMNGMGQSYGMMGSSGMGQSCGMMGGYRGQNQNSSQNYSSSQQAVAGSTTESVNNPSTVLAHTADLNLTTKQVQLLEKMLKSGKQHAALILTTAQRKELAAILGPVWKSKST